MVQLQLKGVCPYQQIHREYTHSLLVWANTYANSEFRFPIRPAALLACCLANVSQFNTNTGIYSSNFDLASTLSWGHSLPMGRCYSNCCRSFPGHCWGQGYCGRGSHSSGRGLNILSCSVYSSSVVVDWSCRLTDSIVPSGICAVSNKSLHQSGWRSITA